MEAIVKDMIYKAREQARELVANAMAKAMDNGDLPQAQQPKFLIEIPADTSHGDFATNAAMAGAKAFRMAPAKIAQAIIDNMSFEGSVFEKAESAGPGFINLFLDKLWFPAVVSSIISLGSGYGRTDYGKGKKVMVEFVSANPTGPMHMGNARGGAMGDCLSAALDAAGYNAEREFYINDAGNQVEKFGISLEARYLQIYKGEDNIEFPEDGYHGDDIKVRAKEYADMHGDSLLNAESAERRAALVEYAMPKNIEKLREDLLTYRVEYNTWFHESDLHRDKTVDKVIGILTEKGLTYEKDDALWYKASEFGCEKDEVLVRGNGYPTYFAVDIAYHYNKFVVRGFEKVINLWGADHHGHVARLKGAMDAIGLSGDMLDIVLFQFVNLLKDGQPYKMSKRTGKSITLADLVEEVPIDAARYFFNARDVGSTIDFDMNLAVEQSNQNPVYYIQYAHARICSIFKKLEDEGIKLRKCSMDELALLSAPEEIELIRLLAKYPGEIVLTAESYDPTVLPHYVNNVAAMFHKFYNAHKVKLDDEKLMQARMTLCGATKTVIANVLALMKITAPERM